MALRDVHMLPRKQPVLFLRLFGGGTQAHRSASRSKSVQDATNNTGTHISEVGGAATLYVSMCVCVQLAVCRALKPARRGRKGTWRRGVYLYKFIVGIADLLCCEKVVRCVYTCPPGGRFGGQRQNKMPAHAGHG